MEEFKSGFMLGKIWTRQFFSESKLAVVLLFTIVFLFVYVSPLRNEAANSEYGITPYIIPLICDANTMYMVFILVLLVCDAPFFEKNHLFVSLRCSAGGWFIGKAVYVLAIAVIFQIIQLIISVMLLLPYLSISSDWGYTLTNVVINGFTQDTFYSGFAADRGILLNYSGLEALSYQLVLNVIFTYLIGMVAFLFNGIFKRYTGTIIIVLFAIADKVIESFSWYFETLKLLEKYSLTGMIRLSVIVENEVTVKENMIVMVVIALSLTLISYVAVKKRVIRNN